MSETWQACEDGSYTCGSFSMRDGVVTGPAEYMQQAGHERLRRIEAGKDVLVNYALEHGLSPNAETAILVSLQTDFARWLGDRELRARSEVARASQLEFMRRMAEKRAVEDAAKRAAYRGRKRR